MMKTIATKFLILSLVSLTFFSFMSCDDDEPMIMDDGSTTSLPAAVVTTYEGDLVYTSATGEVITALDGEAEIRKSGSSYIIEFSDGVPDLTGLNFNNEDGSYATVGGGSSVAGIVIDGDDLDIGATQNGNTWAFSGSK